MVVRGGESECEFGEHVRISPSPTCRVCTTRHFPLSNVTMIKNKTKNCISSPLSRVTQISATNDTLNNSEAAVPSTQPQPHPRKKKKNNQSLPVTTSFQDPFYTIVECRADLASQLGAEYLRHGNFANRGNFTESPQMRKFC